MGMGKKVIGLAVAGVLGTAGVAAWMKSKREKQVAPGSVQEVGRSNTSWLIETGTQTYGALTALGRNVYAAPGTQYQDDLGQVQLTPTYLPVLVMVQVANDKSTRSLIQAMGPKDLVDRAVDDLGIKRA